MAENELSSNKVSDKSVIDLIDQQIGLHPKVAALREKGRESFLKIGLPENKAEEFRHTPITRLLQKNLSLEPRQNKLNSVPANDLKVEGLDAYQVVFVNGIYAPALSSLPAGSDIVVKPLADAVDGGDPLVLEHLGNYADHQT